MRIAIDYQRTAGAAVIIALEKSIVTAVPVMRMVFAKKSDHDMRRHAIRAKLQVPTVINARGHESGRYGNPHHHRDSGEYREQAMCGG
jgi:hypothetical protein